MSIGRAPVGRRRAVPVRRPKKDPEGRDDQERHPASVLQRSAGNRAVTGLLQGRAPTAMPSVLLVQRAPSTISFNGLPLGTNASGTLVKAKRVLGSEQGYDDRWQATAVARIAKAEPAAVAQRADTQRWYAVEVAAPFAAGRVGSVAKGGDTSAGANPGLAEVHGLPSLAGLPQALANVKRLKQRSAELRARQPRNKAEKEAVDAEHLEVLRQLNSENVRRMALVLGVTETEIQWNRSKSGRSSGKINVTGAPDAKSSGGAHGHVLGQDPEFSPTLVTAIEIDEPQFDDPGRAATVLLHETSHLKDMRLAQEWVQKYQTEAKRYWVAGPPGAQPFMTWLNAQVKRKRLTAADAQLVIDQTLNAHATTEARANVRAFLEVLRLGDANQALQQLRGYARALKPGGQYAAPLDPSPVVAELVAELKAAYQKLTPPRKADYRAAVDAAIAENPKAWITALKFYR